MVTGLELEYAQPAGLPFIGGALDLLKCFDQVVRPLLDFILMLAGIPTCVLHAYIRYHEHVLVYNSVASTIGMPHQHRCGIPQGYP
eukprot:1230606-Karenia_brevis.AAC.1